MFKKLLYILFNLSLVLGVFYCYTFIQINNLSSTLKVIIISISILIYMLCVIFKWCKLHKLCRFIYVSFIVYSFIFIIYAILYKYNIIQVLSSVNKLKEYILSTKQLGVLVYILLQLLQVIFLPIPASVICIVGSLIYGPLLGGLYCCIGVLIGSYISFILGKVFGVRLVSWIVGKNNAQKYSSMIAKRGGFFLCIAFLLPMFPDDILCLIAGITNMTFKSFFWIALITRPVGVICMSFFGSGHIIPFNGWGLYVWGAILIIAVVLIFITYKYQEQIQNFVLTKIFKKKPKKSN